MCRNWVAGKTATVKRYARSSFYVGRNVAGKGQAAVDRLLVRLTTPSRAINLTLPKKLAPELDYVAHGGGFPIRLKGQEFTNPIGVIVVSGLPQEQDHQLVVDACRKVLGKQETSSVVE